MLEQPDSPTASHTKQQVFDHYLHRLQNEIHAIIASEAGYEERIKSLEADLTVYKRACFSAEDEKRILNEEIVALREQLDLVIKNPGKVVCVIDGDGTIFATDLLARGCSGGQLAAKSLSDSITFHIPCPIQLAQVWVYVFFDKRALVNDLATSDDDHRQEAIDRLDEFVIGFNQSCGRFIMIDVGDGEDTVSAKVKAFVEEHAYSQETTKVLFGGCHDNRYVPMLHSLLESGLREKLVLLPGYVEMASEIRKFPIPSLIVPNLFVPERLNAGHHHLMTNFAGSRQSPTTSAGSSLNQNHLDATGSSSLGPPPGLSPHQSTSQSQSTAPVDAPSQNAVSTTPPPPYHVPSDEHSPPSSDDSDTDEPSSLSSSISSFEAIHVHKRSISDGDTVSYCNTMQSKYEPVYPPRPLAEPFTLINPNGLRVLKRSSSRGRRINPNIPLSQHDPPPCTLYYLANNGCKHGTECRFGHDYQLSEDDYDIVRNAARKVPCPSANRGDICIFGEQCCYGHSCPFASKCHYMRHGKCKFAGPNMHGELTM